MDISHFKDISKVINKFTTTRSSEKSENYRRNSRKKKNEKAEQSPNIS